MTTLKGYWPSPRDTRLKSVSQGCHQCRRAELGVERYPCVLSAKASIEKIGVDSERFTPQKVSTSPPLNLESYIMPCGQG
jgi:hypothetical protein